MLVKKFGETKMKRQKTRHGRKRPIAAVLLLALLMAPIASAKQIVKSVPLSETEFIQLAKNNPEELFKKTAAHFKKTVFDYTGTLEKQERVKGKLGKEQTVEFKFREKPFSILITWKKNAGKIDKMLYVEKQNKNKMLVHPTGLLSFIRSVEKDPLDKEVLKSSRKPCTEFGFLKVLNNFVNEYKPEPAKPNVRTEFVKVFEKDQRKYVVLQQSFTNPQKGKEAKRTLIYDIELMLPVEREAFDSEDKLLYHYTYKNLKFNIGLTDLNFTPKANGLD